MTIQIFSIVQLAIYHCQLRLTCFVVKVVVFYAHFKRGKRVQIKQLLLKHFIVFLKSHISQQLNSFYSILAIKVTKTNCIY